MVHSSSSATESLWPARLAILTIIALQVILNGRLTAGPNWLLPGLEAALLLPISVVRQAHHRRGTLRLAAAASSPAELGQGYLPSHGAMRTLALALIAFLNVARGVFPLSRIFAW